MRAKSLESTLVRICAVVFLVLLVTGLGLASLARALGRSTPPLPAVDAVRGGTGLSGVGEAGGPLDLSITDASLSGGKKSTTEEGAGPGTLEPGDIAIIHYRYAEGDEFAFVALVALAPGTEVSFTDAGWDGPSGQFGTTERTWVWTAPSQGLGAGAVVTCRAQSCSSGMLAGREISLQRSGDQVIAFQGVLADPAFIYAVTSNTWLTTGRVTQATSYLPAGLVDGSTARDFGENAAIGYYSVTETTGTVPEIQSEIGSVLNWTRGDVDLPEPPDWAFTVLSSAQFSFAIAADMRDSLTGFRAVGEAIRDLPGGSAFMISPGDIDGPVWEVYNIITETFGVSYRWYPVVGNHEIPGYGIEPSPGDNMRWLNNYDYVNVTHPPSPLFPAKCLTTTYSFDYGNAHFSVLNEYCDEAGHLVPTSTLQAHLYNWLEEDLRGTAKEHIFVFGHAPAYPQPEADGGDRAPFRNVGRSLDLDVGLRDRFWDLLVREGVDAYICGHTHTYNLANVDGVWQLDVSHARGRVLPSKGYGRSTFALVHVNGDVVTLHVYRLNDSGDYVLADSGILACPECSATWYTGTADTYIDASSPMANYGDEREILVGDDPDRGALLKWEPADVLAGSTVLEAFVTLSVTTKTRDAYELYEVKRDWVEDQATWISYTDALGWQIRGARGSDDVEWSAELGAITVYPSNPSEYTPDQFLIAVRLNGAGVDLIQRWLDDPSGNYGLILADYVSSYGDELRFVSSEGSSVQDRPKLTLFYRRPESEPSDVGLSKVVTPTVVAPGGTITYSLSFSNAGPGTAEKVIITDVVPTSVSMSSTVVTGSVQLTQNNVANVYTWTTPHLPADQGGVITLTAVVSDLSSSGVVINRSVIAGDLDSDPGNNRSEVSATLDADPPSVPVLVRPADGTLTSTSALTLSWGVVADAAGYWLDWNGTLIDADTRHPMEGTREYGTGVLADGVYTWTVAAYDAVDNISAFAGAWSFEVDTATCTQVTGVQLTQVTTGTIYPGAVVEFRADILPDDAAKPYTYTVDYCDGNPIVGASALDPLLLDHVYGESGHYTVTLEVRNCKMTVPMSRSALVEVSERNRWLYLPLVLGRDADRSPSAPLR